MGRELKRVPMDFDWPINRIWYGYRVSFCQEPPHCEACRHFARLKGIPLTSYDCPETEQLFGPPKGEGFQLWETTSEGSPVSPVFTTLDDLCKWCESNATVFGSYKAPKEQWEEMLEANFVALKIGNAVLM